MISNFRIAVLALMPALAVALGGSVERAAQGVVLVAAGLAMLVFPVRMAPPRWLWAGALFLAVWPLAAFLPAWGMGGEGGWRALLGAAGVAADAPLRTVQPWLTAESVALLAAGLAWAVYLACQPLDDRNRSFWLQIHVGGLAVVAGAALVLHFAQSPPPFWPEGRFGPFPNRNQTANVFALGGVLAFALGQRQLRHGRGAGALWLGLAAFFLGAVLVNGSRAGLVLLLGGCGVWMVWDGSGARRMSRAALGASGLLLMLAAALFLGGEALDRALATAREGGWTAGSRPAIQRDALALTLDHPVAGAGMGNFDGVFSFYRDRFQHQSRPIHPESDWLWLAGEAGWPAAVMAAVLAALWFRACWPRAEDRDRRLRRAALVAAALFLAHSLIDVPGHRMGSVLAALALLPLAAPPRMPAPAGLGARFALAGMGLLVVLLGTLFLAQASGRIGMPGQVRREVLVREIEANDRAGLHYDAINNCEEGISFAPLDWRFHFFSARSRLRINVGWSQAAAEFARARLLEPDSPLLVLHEGMLWVGRDPARAIDAWSEALRRTDRKREHFRMMLDAARRDERLMARMETLVDGHPELDFFFLHSAPDAVFDQRLGHLLSMTPEAAGFRPEDAGAFFNTWRSRRGGARFAEELAAHPAWEAEGWWWAAESLAGAGQWKEAFALADRHLTPPALPPQEADLARVREQVRRYPDDLPAGFALAAAEGREGDWEGAAWRLQRLCADPQAPAYFHYELAGALRKAGREAEAWKALEHYVRMVR
jgi:hypothetical protein